MGRIITYIPLTDICLRADIPEFDIHVTQLSKNMISDYKALVAKYGLDVEKCTVENLADNDFRTYRQRLAYI